MSLKLFLKIVLGTFAFAMMCFRAFLGRSAFWKWQKWVSEKTRTNEGVIWNTTIVKKFHSEICKSTGIFQFFWFYQCITFSVTGTLRTLLAWLWLLKMLMFMFFCQSWCRSWFRCWCQHRFCCWCWSAAGDGDVDVDVEDYVLAKLEI